jgi:uncharacterized repeat protein (TIGR03803 family)
MEPGICRTFTLTFDLLPHKENYVMKPAKLASIFALTVLCVGSIHSAAQTERVIHSFNGSGDGAIPFQGVIVDSSGALYTVGQVGGPYGYGTVVQLVPPSGAGPWTENILYSFTNGSDGGNPLTNLVMDSSGAIYGATEDGGALGCGTFYQLVPPAGGSGEWTENTLQDLACASNGYSAGPLFVVRDPTTGVIYGSVQSAGPFGGGWIYAMTPPSGGSGWTYTVIHDFNENPAASRYVYGCTPFEVIVAPAGRLYGVTDGCGAGGGTVYRLAPSSSGEWEITLIYTFGPGYSSSNGAYPLGLLLGSDGVLYGAAAGGLYGQGLIYSLTPPVGGGLSTETILHNFAATGDGNAPGPVTPGPGGTLYGETAGGGVNDTSCSPYPGCGTVYQLTPGSGGVWTEDILYEFSPTGGDANNPNLGPLVEHGGNLFGVTYYGGATGNGAVYEVHP